MKPGLAIPAFFMFAFSGKSVVLKNSLQSIAKFVLNLYDRQHLLIRLFISKFGIY
jgi:hypothetical protein